MLLLAIMNLTFQVFAFFPTNPIQSFDTELITERNANIDFFNLSNMYDSIMFNVLDMVYPMSTRHNYPPFIEAVRREECI